MASFLLYSYYDNMSAKQCHDKTLPCSVNDTSLCVTQDEADTVYRLGNWEYSYYYRDAQNSTLYSALHYGAWILELKGHLEAKIAGGQVRFSLRTVYSVNGWRPSA